MSGELSEVFTLVLAFTLLLFATGTAYYATQPSPQETPFTEFYILGPGGDASNYPSNLTTEDEASVIVGIANHERQSMTYRLVIVWNDAIESERDVTLVNGEEEQFPIQIATPAEPGNYELRFLLYRSGDTTDDPYRSLRLLVTVSQATN